MLASAEKLGAASPYVIAPLGDIAGMVVERGIPEEALEPYRHAGLAVHRA